MAHNNDRDILLPVDPDTLFASIQQQTTSASSSDALSTDEFAAALDALPDLPSFRDEFLFPATPATATVRSPGTKGIYLCGNSLGEWKYGCH